MILSYCFENEKTGTHLRTRFLLGIYFAVNR